MAMTSRALIVATTTTAAVGLFQFMNAGSTHFENVSRLAGASMAAGAMQHPSHAAAHTPTPPVATRTATAHDATVKVAAAR